MRPILKLNCALSLIKYNYRLVRVGVKKDLHVVLLMEKKSLEVYLISKKLDSAFLIKMANAQRLQLNANMLMEKANYENLFMTISLKKIMNKTDIREINVTNLVMIEMIVTIEIETKEVVIAMKDMIGMSVMTGDIEIKEMIVEIVTEIGKEIEIILQEIESIQVEINLQCNLAITFPITVWLDTS